VPLESIFQIAFSAGCISPNTPDAVTITVTTPINVAHVPDDLLWALAMADCKSWALSLAHQAGELANNSILCGFVAKGETRNRDNDQQDRRDRGDRIECDGRAPA
jgi:hypothetical protein